MNLKNLMKQKTNIEAAIKAAERIQKQRPKFDKVMQESIGKNPDVLLCDSKVFAKKLDDFLAAFAGNLEHRQQ